MGLPGIGSLALRAYRQAHPQRCHADPRRQSARGSHRRPGQLAIGGAALARGYLDRPDLTAASFIPDPYAAEPGARLYLTGDGARYLARR